MNFSSTFRKRWYRGKTWLPRVKDPCCLQYAWTKDGCILQRGSCGGSGRMTTQDNYLSGAGARCLFTSLSLSLFFFLKPWHSTSLCEYAMWIEFSAFQTYVEGTFFFSFLFPIFHGYIVL